MPEHSRRPGRAGPPPRRHAALAAAALAVIAAVLVAVALAARDDPREAFRSAAAPPAGVDQAGRSAAGADCRAGGPGTVTVGSARELQRALDRAARGQRIRMLDGIYQGEFVLRRSGTASRRITLCGSRRAVLQGGSVRHGYVLHLDGVRHWTLSGFSVTNGEKGVMADRASHNVLQDLEVHHVGHEAIHLRAFSSDNLLRGNLVHHTGLRNPEFGEGLYVGSARGNWCRHSGCRPDRSDRNRILDNRIGPDVTAESVDLKEGTSAGLVGGNTFVGSGMTGADSWVDVKGNGYRVQANRGRLTPQDGFQVHVEAPGWGRDNLFAANQADLGGGEYGVRVDSDAGGTVVGCDNQVSGAGKGLSNIPCR